MNKEKILEICDNIQEVIDKDKDRVSLQFQIGDMIDLLPKKETELLNLANSMMSDADSDIDDENLRMNGEDALKKIREYLRE